MSEEEGKTFIDTSSRDNKPTPPPVVDNGGKKRDGAYIVIIILLLLGAGFMGYMLSENNKVINECSNERQALEEEMIALNEMMYDQGLGRGEDVRKNLEGMLALYDKIGAENTELNDSVVAQKQKIEGLIAELDDAKGDKRYFASKVYKLEKETETLRNIMKDYIRTIDSLNTANGVLTVNLENTMQDLESMTESRNTFQNTAEELSEKVNKGSKLNAFSFLSEGIKEKSSGSYKETDRASRCTHIRSCFALGENSIAKGGNKTVYMRVLTPGGSVLNSSTSNTLKTEGGQSLLYSDKKQVNYQNKQVDVCIFYELTSEIEKGNYITEIYCEGVKIGSDSFVLK